MLTVRLSGFDYLVSTRFYRHITFSACEALTWFATMFLVPAHRMVRGQPLKVPPQSQIGSRSRRSEFQPPLVVAGSCV